MVLPMTLFKWRAFLLRVLTLKNLAQAVSACVALKAETITCCSSVDSWDCSRDASKKCLHVQRSQVLARFSMGKF